MGRNQTVRARLRAATAASHARVDDVFSRFDLSAADDYGRFLQAQAAALVPLERALDRGVASCLPIDWPGRRRSDAITNDLSALGRAIPSGEPIAPIGEPEAALGTIYVLEGSRLGGALLKRAVPSHLPTTFLAPAAPRLWRDLLDVLESLLRTDAQQIAAIRAAEDAFARFERAGHPALAEPVR